MEILRSVACVTEKHRAAAIAIGNFDGVHCGHQALLFALKARALELQCPTLVVIFEPQPNEFFSVQSTPRLMRFREKIRALNKIGIDYVLCLRFDAQLAAVEAEDFVCDF